MYPNDVELLVNNVEPFDKPDRFQTQDFKPFPDSKAGKYSSNPTRWL